MRCVQAPRRLRREDVRHRLVELVALGGVASAAALFEERIVVGIPELGEVACNGVRPVKQTHEVIGNVAVPADARHLQIALVRRRERLPEGVNLEVHDKSSV
jgi:hypothetical protein